MPRNLKVGTCSTLFHRTAERRRVYEKMVSIIYQCHRICSLSKLMISQGLIQRTTDSAHQPGLTVSVICLRLSSPDCALTNFFRTVKQTIVERIHRSFWIVIFWVKRLRHNLGMYTQQVEKKNRESNLRVRRTILYFIHSVQRCQSCRSEHGLDLVVICTSFHANKSTDEALPRTHAGIALTAPYTKYKTEYSNVTLCVFFFLVSVRDGKVTRSRGTKRISKPCNILWCYSGKLYYIIGRYLQSWSG